MPRGATVTYLTLLVLWSLIGTGCATTYIPISREYRAQVHQMSRSDVTLSILFERFDPQRGTLRGGEESFNETMWPSEVPHHLGAYRTDTDLIYTNLYLTYSNDQLRELLIHELAHHIWFKAMSDTQRQGWTDYLAANPSPDQETVRRNYLHPQEFPAEDFAFTIQHARPADYRELEHLHLLTGQESDALVAEVTKFPRRPPAPGTPPAALHDSALNVVPLASPQGAQPGS